MARKRRSDNTGSIFKDKYGYWNAQVFTGYNKEGKKQYLRKRSKVQADVVAWLNTTLGQSSHAPTEKLSFEQYLRRWLDQIKRSNSYGTWITYSHACENHVFGRLGKIEFRKVGHTHLQNFINALDEEGLAHGTITKIRGMLHRAFNDAIAEQAIKTNPMTYVKLPNKDRANAFHASVLTAEQSQLFLASVESHRNKALFWVALLTALRKGELLALRIEDIDFKAQTIRIAASAGDQRGKGMVRTSTKNEASEVIIPFPSILVPILNEHLAMLAEERTDYRWREQGLLFPNTRGGYITGWAAWNMFKKALKAAGLPEEVRFHDLRHSCATLLITLGVHPRIIMEILRHSQIATTMNLYAHAIPQVNREALEQLGDLVMPAILELPDKVRKE